MKRLPRLNIPLSVLAKEKGFDEPCLGYYQKTAVIGNNTILPHLFLPNHEFKWSPYDWNHHSVNVPYYSAPTHKQITDWLFKKHNIAIEIISEENIEKALNSIQNV